MQLDRLCEKALTAEHNCRHALAAVFYGRAAEEALRLHGALFVCTYLTLRRSNQLVLQWHLEGVTRNEKSALVAEARAHVSSTLPLIVRRVDDNTMLPGRGTAVELVFFKRLIQLKRVVVGVQPFSARELQLESLSLGYATAVATVRLVLRCTVGWAGVNADELQKAQEFALRVVDNMQQAAGSLAEYRLPAEVLLASFLQKIVDGAYPFIDAVFVAALRTKWTAAAMVQMCRARRLLDDSTERTKRVIEGNKAKLRADIAKYGLKERALPACGKREASVGEHVRCSACRSTWYCSAEHAALHWREHKPICRATAASQHAAAGDGAARE